MRRIERLINLIAALLESGRPMTAEDIRTNIAGYDQATVEAFRRAFERDKESLRNMGIPLELVKTDPFAEQADGYVIPKDKYYLPDIDLEPDELAALRIAADAVLGASDEAGVGLLKLSLDESPSSVGPGRVAWSAEVAEQASLERLYTALLERHPVSFGYETAGGESGERHVRPYGLVQRRGHWYLVGFDSSADDVRTFRLSRVREPVEVDTSSTYTIPEGVNAADHVVREGWEAGQEVVVAKVRFDPSLSWWVEQNLSGYDTKDVGEGSVDVELPVSNPDAFVSWLLDFGDAVTIVEPAELRVHVLERLSPYLEDAS